MAGWLIQKRPTHDQLGSLFQAQCWTAGSFILQNIQRPSEAVDWFKFSMNTQIPSFQQAPVVGCDGSSRRALQPAPTCPSHVTAARRIRQALAMRSKQPGAPRTRSGHTSIAAGAVSEGWWKTYPDLWIEVDDEHAFEALLRQHTDKLLVVDFWGKTCKGCEARLQT